MMLQNRFRMWVLTGLVCVSGAFTGCMMVKGNNEASLWTYAEQSREVEKLAPLGTPRAEVERRLRAAGMIVTPGSTQALAYCDQWNAPGGKSRPMNVALQFDAEGKLMGMRPAQAETAVIPSDTLAQAPAPTGASTSSSAPGGNEEEGRKDRRRTAFQEAPVRSR